MYDSLTYVYPRSMQEAFGPYTDNKIEEENTMDSADKIVMRASIIAAIALAIIIKVWG